MKLGLSSIRKEAGKLSLIRYAIRIILDAARHFAVSWLILTIIKGFIPAGIVYATKLIVDSIASIVSAGASWSTVSILIIPAALMGGLMLGQQLITGILSWIRSATSEYVADYVKSMIHAKAAQMDYVFFEMPEFYNSLEQANAQAGGRVLSLLDNIGALLQSLVTFLSIGAILFVYSPWLPLVLIVTAFPAAGIVIRYNKLRHTWWVETTQARRQVQYYDMLLTRLFAAAEIRLNRLGGFLADRYAVLRKKLRTENLTLTRKQMLAGLAGSFFGLLVTAGTMLWILWRAMDGRASLGDLALFYQAFNEGRTLAGGLLSNAGQVYTNTLFLEHLRTFLLQKNSVKNPEEPSTFPSGLVHGIEFRDITFAYPGTTRNALENFTMSIPAGKLVAVVGENGAGKSTFIKLLCRFYDPDAGSVTVDRTDIRSFDLDELRRNLAVMFQFPMHYQFTAEENISIGDLNRPYDEADIVETARVAGVDTFINQLPEGFKTLLGRYFEGGTELSGGQWRRMALARAFFRSAPFVILDEPTSFMDSWAELEWLQRFKVLIAGRTGLFITHRFTTAMQADLIHVMKDGSVVESGTHAELLQMNGYYAKSWIAQMEEAESRKQIKST